MSAPSEHQAPVAAKPATGDPMQRDAATQNVLARSAQGASILISLQVGSRALTFVVNQVLIRVLSPELLGVSARFELFNISVLTFCRESIRIALARQGAVSAAEDGTPAAKKAAKDDSGSTAAYEPARRAQSAINLSYAALALGPPFALLFTWWFFWRTADAASAAIPYYREAHTIYVVATLFELVAEPAFAIAAQQSLFRLRAGAETSAAVGRALLSCGLAYASNQYDLKLGALPFAVGQMAFAVAMVSVYYAGVVPRARKDGYAARLKAVPRPTEEYVGGYVRQTALQLAQNLYAQSGLKFLLTQGDAYIMNSFASVSTLGVYSLGANYGGLLARMVFQPIEESSRGVFGGLLAHRTNSDADADVNEKTADKPAADAPKDPKLVSARDYLITVLRLYTLLSLGLVALLPTFAPLLLNLVAGSRWAATEAPLVLGTYAYYLPLLAFNGILEAFVAATAAPDQLRAQNAAMVGFTLAFFGAAWYIVGIKDGGARGVVTANAVNMAMRILYSFYYVSGWFEKRGVPIYITDFTPRALLILGVVQVTSMLRYVRDNNPENATTALIMVGIGAAYGIFMLVMEWDFLVECYRLLRPKATESDDTDAQLKKEE